MLRIIIVEDEHFIRTGLSNMIERLSPNYRVLDSASNGYDGLLLIKQYEPDLAICDIKMGKHDGLEMIAQLRDLNLKTRFVILSGYSEFEYARKAITLGVEEYLLKPVMLDQLTDLLDRMYRSKCQQNGEPEDGPDDARAPAYSLLIVNTLRIIEDAYHDKLTLNDLAGRLGVTPEHLGATFSKEVGTPFSVYLKQYRVEKAIQMLTEQDRKIYEVAALVGYDDPQYFCRVFKDVMGVTPKNYLRSLPQEGLDGEKESGGV